MEFPLKPRGFQKGNKLGAAGRPKHSKNQIEPIRRRILSVVQKRIFREKNLESVETVDLLKFLASIMPKDVHSQSTQVTYISNVPREEPTLIPRETIIENNTPLITEPLPEEKTDEPAL